MGARRMVQLKSQKVQVQVKELGAQGLSTQEVRGVQGPGGWSWGRHLLPLGHTAPPDVVAGGAGELPVHGGDEILLGPLEHSQIGFGQRQEGRGHRLREGTGGQRDGMVTPKSPNIHGPVLLFLQWGPSPSAPWDTPLPLDPL